MADDFDDDKALVIVGWSWFALIVAGILITCYLYNTQQETCIDYPCNKGSKATLQHGVCVCPEKALYNRPHNGPRW